MAEVLARMADLHVRGAPCRAGYLVFSVIDFVQQARRNTPSYEAATLAFRGLALRHPEAVGREVLMIPLARGGGTYRTQAMRMHGLQMLLRLLGDDVEPEFERAFQAIFADAVGVAG